MNKKIYKRLTDSNSQTFAIISVKFIVINFQEAFADEWINYWNQDRQSLYSICFHFY